MPRLSTWMIRAALLYLLTGFSFGGLLLINKGIPLNPGLWSLLPAHIEFLLMGWTFQLVMGMAFWILPRFSRGPKRGNVALAWTSFGLLNLGVLILGIGPLIENSPSLTFIGRFAEILAALTFFFHAWPRIKAAGVG